MHRFNDQDVLTKCLLFVDSREEHEGCAMRRDGNDFCGENNISEAISEGLLESDDSYLTITPRGYRYLKSSSVNRKLMLGYGK